MLERLADLKKDLYHFAESTVPLWGKCSTTLAHFRYHFGSSCYGFTTGNGQARQPVLLFNLRRQRRLLLGNGRCRGRRWSLRALRRLVRGEASCRGRCGLGCRCRRCWSGHRLGLRPRLLRRFRHNSGRRSGRFLRAGCRLRRRRCSSLRRGRSGSRERCSGRPRTCTALHRFRRGD